MAIDARIPMLVNTPDIIGGFQQGSEFAQNNQLNQLALDETRRSQQEQKEYRDLATAYRDVKAFKSVIPDTVNTVNAGRAVEALNLLKDSPHKTSALDALQKGNYQQFNDTLSMIENTGNELTRMGQNGNLPVALQVFENMTQGLSDEDKKAARRINLGLDPRRTSDKVINIGGVPHIKVGDEIFPIDIDGERVTAESVGESEATIAVSAKLGEGIGSNQAKVSAKIIEIGSDASRAAAGVKQSLRLLEEIQTGGFDAAKLYLKSTFGVESADEGQLSNLLGKNVLSQLRTIFGAAFTAKEGDELKTIEAGLGKSNEGNIRVLQDALTFIELKATDAIQEANRTGDKATARRISKYLELDLNQGQEGWELYRDDKFNYRYGRMGEDGEMEYKSL